MSCIQGSAVVRCRSFGRRYLFFPHCLFANYCRLAATRVAILFGKVLRIQSHAQVIFSDPIVIRYGPGVQDHDNKSDDEDPHPAKNPCPVLEFRIVNRLFNDVGGEIM